MCSTWTKVERFWLKHLQQQFDDPRTPFPDEARNAKIQWILRFFETVPYCPKAAPNVHVEPQDLPNLARSGRNIVPKRPKVTQYDPKSAGVRN